MLPISDAQHAYAEQVRDALLAAGLRATVDERDEKVGRKIRDAEEQKVPAMLVVGEREAEAREVSLRRHGRRNLGARPLEAVVAALATENAGRWLDDREPRSKNRPSSRPSSPLRHLIVTRSRLARLVSSPKIGA